MMGIAYRDQAIGCLLPYLLYQMRLRIALTRQDIPRQKYE